MDLTSAALTDKQIRALLYAGPLAGYAADTAARVIPEMALAGHSVRIDLAVLTPTELVGYEIKSDRDTLRRLPDQLAVYRGIFDRLTLVCGPRYEQRLLAMLPACYGLYVAETADGSATLRQVREPTPNPDQTGPALASLLWRDEARALLEGEYIGGLSRMRRWELWDMVAGVFALPVLRQRVRQVLLGREDWRADS